MVWLACTTVRTLARPFDLEATVVGRLRTRSSADQDAGARAGVVDYIDQQLAGVSAAPADLPHGDRRRAATSNLMFGRDFSRWNLQQVDAEEPEQGDVRLQYGRASRHGRSSS
jgi:hypothetical protein